jgi:hypothetical protein
MRVNLFVLTLLILAAPLSAQISYEGCTDARGIPVATVLDFYLGDVAQATLAPNGAPIIRYNPRALSPITPPVVLTWFYLHECAHQATGQVLALITGQVPYTRDIEVQADCWATVNLVRRAGLNAIIPVQQYLVALNNPGDYAHPPSAQRAAYLPSCLQ